MKELWHLKFGPGERALFRSLGAGPPNEFPQEGRLHKPRDLPLSVCFQVLQAMVPAYTLHRCWLPSHTRLMGRTT